MTKVVRIEPTGELIACDGNPVTLGGVAFDGDVDVVHCMSPIITLFAPHRVFVGVVDDWGLAKGLPVNWKAWALYNRSPIFGPMYFADDTATPLPDELIDLIAGPIESWLPTEQIQTMQHIIATNYPEAIS